MQLISEQWIFVVTNYLKTGSSKDVQQLFEQRYWDGISPTKMSIWKNVRSTN